MIVAVGAGVSVGAGVAVSVGMGVSVGGRVAVGAAVAVSVGKGVSDGAAVGVEGKVGMGVSVACGLTVGTGGVAVPEQAARSRTIRRSRERFIQRNCFLENRIRVAFSQIPCKNATRIFRLLMLPEMCMAPF